MALNQSRSKEDFNSQSAPPESQAHGRKDDSPSRHPFDEQIEKTLINDLLKEKKDLEQELQDMMQMRTMPLNESDLNVEGRVREQQRRLDALDSLRLRVNDVLNKFQDDFLEFINRNY